MSLCETVRVCVGLCCVGLSSHSVRTDLCGSEYVCVSEGLSTCEPLLVWAQTACALLSLNVCTPVEVDTRELAGRSVNVHEDVRVCASGQTRLCIRMYVHTNVCLWGSEPGVRFCVSQQVQTQIPTGARTVTQVWARVAEPARGGGSYYQLCSAQSPKGTPTHTNLNIVSIFGQVAKVR